MHRLVLERCVQRLLRDASPDGRRETRPPQTLDDGRIGASGQNRALRRATATPCSRRFAGRLCSVLSGINAALEQFLEPGVDPAAAKPAAQE
jgi:hypothetical protein